MPEKVVELTFEEYNARLRDISRYTHSDGAGNYGCSMCGNTWRAYRRYLYWPIRLHWSWYPLSRKRLKAAGMKRRAKRITWHGWQVGWDGTEQRVFGWTLSIGALKISFGSKERAPERTVYTYKADAGGHLLPPQPETEWPDLLPQDAAR